MPRYKALSLVDLTKRNNLEVFLKKWEKDEKFTFSDNTEAKLPIPYGEHWATLLEDAVRGDQEARAALATKMGRVVFPITSLAKTAEFGGRTTTHEGTDTESNTLQYEVAVVNAVNAFVKEKKGNVDIHLEGIGTYAITGAVQVDSSIKRAGGAMADPKADIILYQSADDYLNSGNIFISHKKDGGPEAFQQYGGLTETAGRQIYTHRQVQQFLSELVPYIGDEGLVQPVMKKITDATLMNMSIFGPDYLPGKKTFGLQNVQLIGQGLPTFKPYSRKKNTYTMEFPHMALNGDLTFFRGGYEPVFGATYRRGRGFTLSGHRYDGVRVGIYPKALMATRKNLVVL